MSWAGTKTEQKKALAAYNEEMTQYAAARVQDFSNLATNVSGRPGLTKQDYDAFRPHQARPVKRKAILESVDEAYETIGLIRNVIDLMSDFACQGVRLVHPNRRIEKFYKHWWLIVDGKGRSEAFLRNLYKDGAVISKVTETAKINKRAKENLFKSVADHDHFKVLRETPIVKNEIPWRYVFLNPTTIELIGGDLALFTGRNHYGIQIPDSLRRKISSPEGPIERDLVSKLPKEVKAAAKHNKLIPLDPDTTSVHHYKKKDSDAWAKPIIYSIWDEIVLLRTLKLADLAALDGAISNIRIFTLGDLDAKIAPTAAGIARLAEILESHTGVGTMDLVWGPEIKLIETSTNVHQFLGEEKYKPTLMGLYQGLGVPPTLTGTFGSGGTTNNFVSLKTLTQRLEYGRGVLEDFWLEQIIKVQKAMGFRIPASVEFNSPGLGDEASEKALLIQLADRNLISTELLQHRFGNDPDLEKIRINKEARERRDGRQPEKVGAFNNPAVSEGLKKIALQSGQATPSEVGLILDDRKEGEKTTLEQQQEMQKEIQKDKVAAPAGPGKKGRKPGQKGQPQQGRPKNSKDGTQRKEKTFKPKIKADATLLVWINNAQDTISDFLHDSVLKLHGKKNMRQLTAKEASWSEKSKFGVLFNLEPLCELDNETLYAALRGDKIPQNIEYEESIETVSIDLDRKLTFDEIRQVQAYLYIIYKTQGE